MKYDKLLFKTWTTFIIEWRDGLYEVSMVKNGKIDKSLSPHRGYTDEMIEKNIKGHWIPLKQGHTICSGCGVIL